MNQTMLLDWEDPVISWLVSGERKALVLMVVTFSNGKRKNKKGTWVVLSW